MSAAVELALEDQEPRRRAGVARRLVQRPSGLVAVVLLGLLVLSAAGASILAPYPPDEIDATNLLEGPTSAHLFGTDELGRDQLSRLMHGGQVALAVAFGSTAVAMTIGIAWGFLSAQVGGWFDELSMRAVDVIMAVPIIMFALILVAALGTSTLTLAIVIGILLAPASARIARAGILTELQQDYHHAAVVAGVPRWRILFGELLPNAAPVLIARAAIDAADAIVIEASLSFIGLGVVPPDASWGTLLREGYDQIHQSLWYPLFPGLAIFLAVWSFNMIGDRLQDVLDPRSRAT